MTEVCSGQRFVHALEVCVHVLVGGRAECAVSWSQALVGGRGKCAVSWSQALVGGRGKCDLIQYGI